MPHYDFGLACNWDYDADFIALLEQECQASGLAVFKITHANLNSILRLLLRRQVTFRVFLDRASDMDIRFLPIAEWVQALGVYCINPSHKTRETSNKAVMHTKLVNAGLPTPATMILPSYQEHPDLPRINTRFLGERFIAKPAHGGGGTGVITDLTALVHVQAVRQQFPHDQYLLQAQIIPVQLDARTAWFRMFYCAGHLFPCWWDPRTHVHTPVTPAEEDRYGLQPLAELTRSVARLCELDLFSTEIAFTADHRWILIDYVNDQIDFRLQSKAQDGMPDALVRAIAGRLAEFVATGEFSRF